jgi:amino acid transporter
VQTGMVHYSKLNVGDPLADVFDKHNLPVLSGVIAFSAIIAMASVLLVFQVGQPRIWMSMSRDGLLPKRFSKLHPKFKTPAFSTLITGTVVAIPTLFLNLREVTDLTSIGTLFAFVLVSGGILILDGKGQSRFNKEYKGFRIPYVSSRYLLPLIWIVTLTLLLIINWNGVLKFFQLFPMEWEVFKHKIPMLLFIVGATALTILAIVKKLSIIPVLGLLTNLYLMTELGIINWMRFLIWLVIGLSLYFTYGYKHSRLNRPKEEVVR